MVLFETNPKKYVQKYVYDQEDRMSRPMAYGKQMADGLEHNEATGDPVLDMMMSQLPKFELMDIPFEVDLPNGKEKVPLLIKPDTYKKDFTAFKEYKLSSRAWKKSEVHKHDQITFYATGFYLKIGSIPKDIELVVVKTVSDGKTTPRASGELWRCPTKRDMIDVLRMIQRIKCAWHGIGMLCEAEIL